MIIGARVRLKKEAATLSGWSGTGSIVSSDSRGDEANPILLVAKDGPEHDALVQRAINGERIHTSDRGVVTCLLSDTEQP